MLCKILRSPFTKQRTVLFCSLRSNPCLYSQQSKNGTPFGVPSCFGGESGIRTHVGLLPNWFRVSPVMTTSISLHSYDAQVCIITMELYETRSNELCSLNLLRIPRPKIDKLACQAQGVGILAIGEISLLDAYCTYLIFAQVCIITMEPHSMRLNELCSLNPLRIPRPKIDKLACQA